MSFHKNTTSETLVRVVGVNVKSLDWKMWAVRSGNFIAVPCSGGFVVDPFGNIAAVHPGNFIGVSPGNLYPVPPAMAPGNFISVSSQNINAVPPRNLNVVPPRNYNVNPPRKVNADLPRNRPLCSIW